MTGARYFNFRQGDRSEYLAQYLLSGLGLATPVPRQEDVGIDFHCAIADQNSGLLTFGHPFCLQVKSSTSPNVVFGGSKDGKWLDREIQWYLKETTPFFLGVVDKSALELLLYSTSATRLAFVKGYPAKLTLTPRRTSDIETGTTWPQVNADPDCADYGDGLHHTVDLGPPVATLSPQILADEDGLRSAKERLRHCVKIEQANIVYASLGTPYFQWLLSCPEGQMPKHAWMHRPTKDANAIKHLLDGLSHPLLSLALSLVATGRSSEAEKLSGALQLLDKNLIPPDIEQFLVSLLR